MKLAKVVGHVVLSHSIDTFAGKSLHITQDLNEGLGSVGEAEVAMAWHPVSEGDMVIVEVARESANAFDTPLPIDAVILGKVDSVHIEGGT